MTELGRLTDDQLGAAGRALLDSAADDAPRSGSRERLLLRLGVATSVLGAAAVANATTLAKTAGGAATGAAAALPAASTVTAAAGSASSLASAGATSGIVAKWVAVGALAGAVTTGTATVFIPPPHAASSAATIEGAATPHPAAAAERTPVSTRRTMAADQVEVSEPEVPEPTSAAKPARPAAASAAERTRIAEEIAMLDAARNALRTGDPAGARRLLERYRTEFGSATLDPEAMVLTIDALDAQGHHAAASAVAKRYLKQHPRSPHADRVRARFRDTPQTPSPPTTPRPRDMARPASPSAPPASTSVGSFPLE